MLPTRLLALLVLATAAAAVPAAALQGPDGHAPAVLQPVVDLLEPVLSLIDSRCDTHTCDRVRLDDDQDVDNVLDTAPAPGAPGPLFWGNATVWTSASLPPDQIGGPFDALQRTAGKSVQWVLTGNPAFQMVWGQGGGLGSSPEPVIILGRTDAPAAGFIPSGAVVQLGLTEQFSSTGICCAPLGPVVLLDSIVDILQYSTIDSQQQSELRVRYTSDTDGLVHEDDWTTYANGEVALLTVTYRVGGDSTLAQQRVVEVEMSKAGSPPLVLSGVRASGNGSIISTIPDSGTANNAHHLLAGAAKLTLP